MGWSGSAVWAGMLAKRHNKQPNTNTNTNINTDIHTLTRCLSCFVQKVRTLAERGVLLVLVLLFCCRDRCCCCPDCRHPLVLTVMPVTVVGGTRTRCGPVGHNLCPCSQLYLWSPLLFLHRTWRGPVGRSRVRAHNYMCGASFTPDRTTVRHA